MCKQLFTQVLLLHFLFLFSSQEKLLATADVLKVKGQALSQHGCEPGLSYFKSLISCSFSIEG